MTKKKIKFISKDKPLLWYLEWVDHCSFNDPGWVPMSEVNARTPVHIKTVGWITKEGNSFITVVPIITGEGSTLGSITILKNCITMAHLLSDPGEWEAENKKE